MLRFFFKRVISAFIVLWVIVTITFFLMHLIPGGPFTSQKNLPPQIKKNIETKYKLNDPLIIQYRTYLVGLLKGDLGPSYSYTGTNVNDIIADAFPISATLGLVSVFLSIIVGMSAGVLAAIKQNKWQDHLTMIFTTVGITMPSFIIATIFIYIFAIKLRLLPGALWGSPEQAILPVLALAALPTAFIARLTRNSMLEVLKLDYIKTARAKGLPETTIIVRHALPNAITPVVSYLGPLIAQILTGSFVVEKIFAIPGLGQFFVDSIYNRDYTTILGVTIFYSTILIVMNFLVDMAYVWIDPRVSLND